MAAQNRGKQPIATVSAFCKWKKDSTIDFKDIHNPHTFFGLMRKSSNILLNWMTTHGLLANEMMCVHCHVPMTLVKREDRSPGMQWRCLKGHKRSVYTHSVFFRSQHPPQDYMTLIYTLLTKGSLKEMSTNSGLTYKSARRRLGKLFPETS